MDKDKILQLKEKILDVKDFPKNGIIFKDIQPLLCDWNDINYIVDNIKNNIKSDFDIVLGLDARGFILGPMIANKFNCGFGMARKPNKIPPPFKCIKYDLEYGTNELCVSTNIIKHGMKVHIHDDLLATGGSAQAAINLIEQCGATVSSLSFIVELENLKGNDKLFDIPHHSVIKY
jgi:adenine phosphoribosyltransferase